MTILPSAYLPSIEYVAHLLREDCVIDVNENYIKRSERNRTSILSANGVMSLTVNVENANRMRQPMRDVKIDYSKRWQHQHLIAIESAYRSSPYYDYYADRFTPLYEREWERLIDLNMATLEAVCKTLKISIPRISETYITAREGDFDLRDKKRGSTLCAEPYIQVFDDRLPFAPNLSIFDLLMCEGPEAINYLKRTNIKG